MHLNRVFSAALFGAAVAVLAGCPVYPDNPGDYRVCDGRACWDCPDNYYSSDCSTWQCASDYDCPSAYYCSASGQCVASGGPSYGDGGFVGSCNEPGQCPQGENCGADDQCHPGDCATSGCPNGYVCELAGGTVQCVPQGNPVEAGVPDTSIPDSGPPPFTGCQTDADCGSTPGAKCLDGVCVPPSNQCFDGAQCPAGDQCVAGVCTPTCGAGKSCPTGYTCDPNGDCTGNPTPCAGADANICPAGTVCAQNHCAAPCGDGGACPSGEVCVQGGCVPNEQPSFTCNTTNDCANGSICLHHSCFISCDPDAGANACKTADQFPVCKTVTTSGGTVNVCGSSTNLGNQCNPTTGQGCPAAGAVCIDGYCR